MGLPNYNKDLESFLENEKEPFGSKLCKMNKFLKSVQAALKSSNNEEKDKYIESIKPGKESTEFFARKTKLELANVLKRPGPIFDVWKSDDNIFLQRAFQFPWVFKDTSNSPLIKDPDFVVNQLFPKLSHSCKRKVVYQIGKLGEPKDFENVTKIYNKIEQIYGINLARYLIPSCNPTVIERVIKERKIKLGHNQLFNLYKKQPESALKYLDALYQELKENISSSHSHSNWHNIFFHTKDSCPFVLSTMAKDNPAQFMKLFEKYDSVLSDLTLGHRLTHHLIKHDRNKILSNPCAYSVLLNKAELIKRLTPTEFDQFFCKLLPESVTNFQAAFEIGVESYHSLHSWLDKYPPKERFNKLESAFQSSYSKSIFDYPEFFTSRLIQLLPPEQRGKWVDIRLAEKSSSCYYHGMGNMPARLDAYWEAFRPTEKSIPKIKQFLSTESDIHSRADLLASLVLTCAVNEDKESLKEVCQFVSTRYRNDSPQVRLEFLSTLCAHFDLLKLDEDHWKPINELLHISSINNEFSYRSHILESYLEKSIHFRVKRDLPVDTQIQHYIKMKSRSYCRGESWCVATSDPILEKKCLKLFAEHLGVAFPLTMPSPSDSSITSAIISLFESFAGWNRRRQSCKSSSKNDFMTAVDYPWLIKRLQDVLESYHEGNKQRVIDVLSYDPSASKMLQPRLIKQCPVPSILKNFLKKDPQKLDEFSDEIIDFMLASNSIKRWKSTLAKLRNSGMYHLSEKYVNKCLSIAEDEEESLKERSNSIYILSFLLSPQNFVEWIPKFYPQEEPKLEVYSAEEIGVMYGMRKMIVQCISNLCIPPAGLPAVTQFCKGDYLKLTVGSLYSIAEKSPPSTKLTDFLKELSGRPVSVKKHAIRLMLAISTTQENIQFLRNLWETEKHYSIRTIVFNRIFEFFIQNNSEEAWELLKTCINSLTSNDHPFLDDLSRLNFVTNIPHEKLSEYLEVSLKKFGELEGTLPETNKMVEINLLQCIFPRNIQYIQESLLESIFDQHLFILSKGQSNLQSAIVSLAVNYLLHYPQSTKGLQVVTKYLKRLLEAEWKNSSKDLGINFPAKNALTFFVERLAMDSFKLEIDNPNISSVKSIFEQLHASLKSSLEVCEFFVDHLYLKLAVIFHTHLPTDKNALEHLTKIGTDIGKLVDQTVAENKPEIVPIISEVVKRFISLCYKGRLTMGDGDGVKIIFIVEGILDSTGSIDTQIVAAQQLLQMSSSSVPPKGHKFEIKYAEIVKKLKEIKDKTVQIFFHYMAISSQFGSARYDVLV